MTRGPFPWKRCSAHDNYFYDPVRTIHICDCEWFVHFVLGDVHCASLHREPFPICLKCVPAMILRHVVSSCAKINQIMVIDCEMMIENEFRMLALLCRLLLSTCLLNKICYRTRVSPSIGCKRMTLQYTHFYAQI